MIKCRSSKLVSLDTHDTTLDMRNLFAHDKLFAHEGLFAHNMHQKTVELLALTWQAKLEIVPRPL